MEIILDISKSFEENIKKYFEKLKRLEERLKEIKERKKEVIKKTKERKREWYEKFRWFFTSNGFLVIAGKDKNTNELLIRKYLREKDIVVHTDIVGSPFGIIRIEKEGLKEEDIYEACQFVASYSRAWRAGLSSIRAYWVKGDQVSKRAPSGEYLPKGSFMIYGKRNYIDVDLKLAIGIDEKGNIIHGVPTSVSKKAKRYVVLIPGEKSVDEILEEIKKVLNIKNREDIEEIKRWIPSWGSNIEKVF